MCLSTCPEASCQISVGGQPLDCHPQRTKVIGIDQHARLAVEDHVGNGADRACNRRQTAQPRFDQDRRHRIASSGWKQQEVGCGVERTRIVHGTQEPRPIAELLGCQLLKCATLGSVSGDEQLALRLVGQGSDRQVNTLLGHERTNRDRQQGVLIDLEFRSCRRPLCLTGRRESFSRNSVRDDNDLAARKTVVIAHDVSSRSRQGHDTFTATEERLGAQASCGGGGPEQRIADLSIDEGNPGPSEGDRTGEQRRRAVSDHHVEAACSCSKCPKCGRRAATRPQGIDGELVPVSPRSKGDGLDLTTEILQTRRKVGCVHLRATPITIRDHLEYAQASRSRRHGVMAASWGHRARATARRVFCASRSGSTDRMAPAAALLTRPGVVCLR